MSLRSDARVIKQPTLDDDNTFIYYAINDVEEQADNIAKNDTRVKQIISETKGKAATIAAVQATLLVGADGEPIHSSGGQVIITANWQVVDGSRPYSSSSGFDGLKGKRGANPTSRDSRSIFQKVPSARRTRDLKRAKRCGGWDSNPRTPKGRDNPFPMRS
jgi:hypothetical protein